MDMLMMLPLWSLTGTFLINAPNGVSWPNTSSRAFRTMLRSQFGKAMCWASWHMDANAVAEMRGMLCLILWSRESVAGTSDVRLRLRGGFKPAMIWGQT